MPRAEATLPPPVLPPGWFPRLLGTPGPRPPLLCLHGLGDCGTSFETLASASALRPWALLAPDVPGYGQSPRPPEPSHLRDLASELAAALGDRPEPPVVLLGHSMGGTLAHLVAEMRPERVAALVNVEGNLCLNDCALSGPVAASSLRGFLESGLADLLSRADEVGREDPGMARYASTLRLADPATLHRHARDLVELSKPADLARRMAGLPVPNLYVAGSPGGVGPRSLDLLREAGVRLAVLSPSGHCPHRDDPEGFALCVAEFLEREGIPPRARRDRVGGRHLPRGVVP